MSEAMKELSWESYSDRSVDDRAEILQSDGRPFHVLLPQQFDREALDRLGSLATRIRRIAKNREGAMFLQRLMCDKRAMLYFTQPSSRTFLSFSTACQILGIRIGEVRDTATSSEYKGESQEDSVRTFSSYFDLIVMRTQAGGLAEQMAWALSQADRSIPILNAGSGADQHPTQALLDIYTLQRSFEERGGIDGKHVVFVGDLRRGRTVRSLSIMLLRYSNVRITFVAPESLQVSEDVLARLDSAGCKYRCTDRFNESIADADAVYMTRIQDEWDEAGEVYDIKDFSFRAEHLDLLPPTGIIMHPLPRRTEISTDVDHDPRAMYWRQMRNGMWIRAALIATIFGHDEAIRAYEG